MDERWPKPQQGWQASQLFLAHWSAGSSAGRPHQGAAEQFSDIFCWPRRSGERMDTTSIWQASSAPLAFSALKGDLSAEILVIGAGITGATAALLLAQAGRKVIVVEAGTVGDSSTGRSTGNLYVT